MRKTCKLALEDGSVFSGEHFGADGELQGEVVFNTSMTGYQEILTDPSYRGQIVTMTYPQIGNYGVNDEDVESWKPHLSGFVVRELSRITSNFRSTKSLHHYLADGQIVGLSGIDTRALTRRIRQQGAMGAVISSVDLDDRRLIEKAKSFPGLVGRDLVKEVLPTQLVNWNEPLGRWWDMSDVGDVGQGSDTLESRPHLVALDFGMKRNIARHLFQQGFRVTIMPGTASIDEILEREPDGVFLSNGPGDPAPLTKAIDTIRQLLQKVPVFGICLGHQLLALACGAQTFKLKFGHRGANQPVLDLETGKVEITSQNHGFAVDEASLPKCLEVSHRHMNDDTVAGLRHKEFPAFSVQYHPEASAGPHDSCYLFSRFREMMEKSSERVS